jgi:hypothetical protein
MLKVRPPARGDQSDQPPDPYPAEGQPLPPGEERPTPPAPDEFPELEEDDDDDEDDDVP